MPSEDSTSEFRTIDQQGILQLNHVHEKANGALRIDDGLKREATPTEDSFRPENVVNMQILAFSGFACSITIYVTKAARFVSNLIPQGAAIFIHSLPMKGMKKGWLMTYCTHLPQFPP